MLIVIHLSSPVSIDPFYVLHPRGAADGATSTEDATDIPYNAAEEERRAWGLPTDEEHTYFDGLGDSFVHIRDFLASQTVPFDGVLGFSQGAAIASMTACLVRHSIMDSHPFFRLTRLSVQLEDATRYPAFLVNEQLPHPPMKFAVCISGAVSAPLDSNVISCLTNIDWRKETSQHAFRRLLQRRTETEDAHPSCRWKD